MLKDVMGRRLPVRTIGEYEGASAWKSNLIVISFKAAYPSRQYSNIFVLL